MFLSRFPLTVIDTKLDKHIHANLKSERMHWMNGFLVRGGTLPLCGNILSYHSGGDLLFTVDNTLWSQYRCSPPFHWTFKRNTLDLFQPIEKNRSASFREFENFSNFFCLFPSLNVLESTHTLTWLFYLKSLQFLFDQYIDTAPCRSVQIISLPISVVFISRLRVLHANAVPTSALTFSVDLHNTNVTLYLPNRPLAAVWLGRGSSSLSGQHCQPCLQQILRYTQSV